MLAQRAAAKVGLFTGPEEPQQQLIDRLADRGVIGATQRTLFHDLRRVGKPMQIEWDLARPMPASFFQEIKIAAG